MTDQNTESRLSKLEKQVAGQQQPPAESSEGHGIDSAEFVRRYTAARADGCPQVLTPVQTARIIAGKAWNEGDALVVMDQRVADLEATMVDVVAAVHTLMEASDV
jgi:hypothetical protein